MTDTTTIRPATPDDIAELKALYIAAFPDEDLVPLVRALLEEPSGVMSQAAVRDGVLVGHATFTLCTVGDDTSPIALLGPLCAAPQHQGEGIGSALVNEGIERLRAQGVAGVLVLGDPAYYGRFGFVADHQTLPPYELSSKYRPGWQALALLPGAPLPAGRLKVPPVWRVRALWSP